MNDDEKRGHTEGRTLPDDLKHLPEEAQNLLLDFLRNPPPENTYPEPMLPHWEAFPDLGWPSIGWRMGAGEDYDMDFLHWFLALTNDAQNDYIEKNPEPKGWDGFWKRVDNCCKRMKAQKP